ncbi:hypothetical protein SteCoe_11545 [Stentor coeruleus]|uniref:Glutathione transferase n=1 Tax=Stentor coeruleus TaxID=5963 RepID=A0A1R2CCZ7_9CILI|nr:hypothetical protein SteCoe_11545 [Stentor coeruleus]
MGCGGSKNNAEHVTSTNNITLHYFDIYGRGEVIRMILQYHGASYSDHKIQQDKWPALRSSGLAEFGALPCLEIDGHKLVESRAIARYICRKFNYYPNDPKAAYMVESICDVKEGINNDIIPLFFKKDMDGLRKYFSEDIPWWLEKIEHRLCQNQGGNGWFVGNAVSLADFEVFHFVHDVFLRNEMKGNYEHILTDKAPKLKAWAHRLLASSQSLKTYLETRPSRPL